jgi:ribosomal subunit interface protein
MATKDDQFGTGLRVKYKATGLTMTPEIKAYVAKKLVAIERQLNPKDTSVYGEIELERTTRHHRQGQIFRTEMNLFVQGVQYRVETTGENLYPAIDAMKDDLLRELKQIKGKKVAQARRGAARAKKMLRGV